MTFAGTPNDKGAIRKHMNIIKLDSTLRKTAAEVLATAFFDYPMFTLYFPDPKRRARSLSWYLGNVLNCALHYGEVYVTPEISGVLFYLPPGHTRITLREYMKNGFLRTPFRLGFHNYVRSMDCERFVGDAQEKVMNGRLHYYLWGLAVHPGQQQKGVGTSLMKPLLEKADLEKMPIYLETHNEKNVAYYQRMGFDMVYTDSIPKNKLQIWCMVREAR